MYRNTLNLFSICLLSILLVLNPAPASATIDKTILSKPKPVPAFSLKDQSGKAFEQKNLKGKWSIILLGYTHCPDVCPFTLQNMALVYEELKAMLRPDSLPQVVFLAVDPERDQEHLESYVPHFDPSFKGITGDPEQIKLLVEGIQGFYRLEKKSKDDEAYTVRHSAKVDIISPNGEMIASVNPPMEPVETARFIAQMMRDHNKKHTN